ncbi:hypothetical protein SprV_0702415800 [Sparganum proliferum]
MQRLSNGKAPRSDTIPAEIYKYGGPQLRNHLTALFQEMLRQGGPLQEFKDATIVHLHKRKGNRQPCDNHRGISLLYIARTLLNLHSLHPPSLPTFHSHIYLPHGFIRPHARQRKPAADHRRLNQVITFSLTSIAPHIKITHREHPTVTSHASAKCASRLLFHADHLLHVKAESEKQPEEQPTGTEDGASGPGTGALQGGHHRTQRATEKNCLHNAYVDNPTDDKRAAFYRSRRLLQQQLREVQEAWPALKAEEIQGYADSSEWKNIFSAIKAFYGPSTEGTSLLIGADGSTLLTEKTQILQLWLCRYSRH